GPDPSSAGRRLHDRCSPSPDAASPDRCSPSPDAGARDSPQPQVLSRGPAPHRNR
ncbi:hypothetical protein P7K49_036462, partial [Saguinus oedipus]